MEEPNSLNDNSNENANKNESELVKKYFQIIGRIEKIKWISSKRIFEIGCSEQELKNLANDLHLDHENLINELNKYLSIMGKLIVPFLEKKKIRYFVMTNVEDSGLELDSFAAGVFGIAVGIIELNNGTIKKEELLSLFAKNKKLKSKISQINGTLKFLESMSFLKYNTKNKTYELGSFGIAVLSKKARNELSSFFQENLYK